MTGRWVCLCEERVVVAPVVDVMAEPCPFCAGDPDGVWVRRGEARVAPHRTPALRVEAREAELGPGRREALGCHEVIVEAQSHDDLTLRPQEVSEDALLIARDRHADLWGDRRLAWLGWRRAGGQHPLASVVGAAVVPTAVAEEEEVRGDLHAVVEAALREGARVCGEIDGAVAFCPLAPERPFEVLVAPPHLRRRLADATDAEVRAAARACWRVERALAGALQTTRREVTLHQSSRGGRIAWYLRVRPIVPLSTADLGGALPSHPAFPEAAAARLRPLWHDALRDRESIEVRR